MRPYSVDYWGSHPDDDNDDCWTGEDFATLEEARARFAAEVPTYYRSSTAYVVLDGPGVHEERRNPGFKPAREVDSEWRREMAMEAGMAFGCDAYNDAMGYGLGPEIEP
jgi:hypothetical protein